MLTKIGKKRYKKFKDSEEVAHKRQKKNPSEANGCTSKESEVFRTDLLQSMKSEVVLPPGSFPLIPIQDKWKEEWNHGVQVCVNNTIDLLDPTETVRCPYPEDFVLPAGRILCHPTSSCPENADVTSVSVPPRMYYSGGLVDQFWVDLKNEKRKADRQREITLQMVYEVLNALEYECYQNTHFELLQPVQRNEDEDAACDVCGLTEPTDDDEIVFCDGCNLSVHQSCYGLLTLPTDDWLCTWCALRYGKKTPCVLCPNLGGAMKCTADGTLWAHVSCALWMPEVRFGNADSREPICNLNDIRRDRLQLRCNVCELREGACIQCSAKGCHEAFHVVCGQRAGLSFKIEDDASAADGVRMVALCQKHSKSEVTRRSSRTNRKKEEVPDHNALKEAERYFPLYVNVDKITQVLNIDRDIINEIHALWLCKRKENNCRPLIREPVGIDVSESENARVVCNPSTLDGKIERIVAHRGNMERARNLCYQVAQREKKKRSLVLNRIAIYEKTMEMMTKPTVPISSRILRKMMIFYGSKCIVAG